MSKQEQFEEYMVFVGYCRNKANKWSKNGVSISKDEVLEMLSEFKGS